MGSFRLIFLPLFLAAICILTGCQSRPMLAQVSADAPEKPINTQEAADSIKKRFEK